MTNSKFDVDVFISYAHLDDRSLFKDEEGWVTQFHKMLDVRLGEYLGKTPQIWRDSKLHGNDIFGDEIHDTIMRSAALICILSPRYVNSEWCKRELNTFIQAYEDKLRVDNKSRLFKLVKTFIPRDSHPESVRKLLGYEFYEKDPIAGKPRELRLEIEDKEVKRHYFELVDDIAYNLKEVLMLLSQDAQAENGDSDQPAEDKKKVFLATTTSDLREDRENIRRELERRGYIVFPNEALPVVHSEMKELVENSIAECDLSIHLLGENYGFIPEGGKESAGEIQLDIARKQVGKTAFHPIVWMPEQLQVDSLSEQQQTFIQGIRADADFLRVADLVQSPLGNLKTLIDQRLAEPPKIEEVEIQEEGPCQIYLICDERDLEDIRPLDNWLFEQGFDVKILDFEGSHSDQREEHQYYLSICDGVLIYYGHANRTWLEQKLQNLRKLPGYGRKKPLEAKCIYLGPPEARSKTDYRTHYPIEIISGLEGFSPDQLQLFKETCKGSHG